MEYQRIMEVDDAIKDMEIIMEHQLTKEDVEAIQDMKLFLTDARNDMSANKGEVCSDEEVIATLIELEGELLNVEWGIYG